MAYRLLATMARSEVSIPPTPNVGTSRYNLDQTRFSGREYRLAERNAQCPWKLLWE